MVCALILFNVYYFTALHHAAWQSHKEVMQPLLSAGASLSLVDEEVVKSSVNLRS
jgi:ankyrin repeat protein